LSSSKGIPELPPDEKDAALRLGLESSGIEVTLGWIHSGRAPPCPTAIRLPCSTGVAKCTLWEQECCAKHRTLAVAPWSATSAAMYNEKLTALQWALNSAVECHLHTVEVIGSNPIAPTIFLTTYEPLSDHRTEWSPSLRPAPTSYAAELCRTGKFGQRGAAANEDWRNECFFNQPSCALLSNRIIFGAGFHADAPIYIPAAKTRIPAAPVTCEHICGST
jgi:hypothetical protein